MLHDVKNLNTIIKRNKLFQKDDLKKFYLLLFALVISCFRLKKKIELD